MNPDGPGDSLYGHEAPPPVKAGPGLLDQVTGVFTDPAALFQRLGATPAWGAALALILVLNGAITAIWALRVDADAMLRPILERDPRIPADRIDSIIALQSRFLLPFGVPGAVVAITVVFLLFALFWWLVGKLAAEGEAPSFRLAFSATVVSNLVALPKFIILGIVCSLRNLGGARLEALSPTSLGFYVATESIKLQAFYHALDLFSLAWIVLLFLAARHALRLKPGGAFLCAAIAAVVTFGLPVLFAR